MSGVWICLYTNVCVPPKHVCMYSYYTPSIPCFRVFSPRSLSFYPFLPPFSPSCSFFPSLLRISDVLITSTATGRIRDACSFFGMEEAVVLSVSRFECKARIIISNGVLNQSAGSQERDAIEPLAMHTDCFPCGCFRVFVHASMICIYGSIMT